jgi:hypothetical protein
LDIHLDPYCFTTTSSFEPVRTSKAGIFVCGAFQGPKDIPTSVIESSASAAMAESILADSRWSKTKTKTIPEEIDGKIAELNFEFSQLPQTQRQLLGIERKFKLTDAVYTSMLEKRVQAQIARASNVPDCDVIEPARYLSVAKPKYYSF